ncbi:Txe/YoeB family addiction module toxin [Psychroflexus sp. CAK1W]|uniref:Txe/YoeB family addiction module toxin n=1 Tax=Psychroflexus curvus TaxID=2873595 RepID=UPI001CCA12D1|nr:Txe/YoeB family addiction module toxin [Psychroflexus curvus]MBZ9629096.1 Txe/YoeB family addiction module toxin [Psychroflexus curvus]
MGKFRIKVEKAARLDFDKVYKTGNKASIKKIEQIITELSEHPYTGTGNPEQLKYNLTGYWSRRINKKDRIVYQVIEEPDRLVVIVSALGHY